MQVVELSSSAVRYPILRQPFLLLSPVSFRDEFSTGKRSIYPTKRPSKLMVLEHAVLWSATITTISVSMSAVS